MKKKASLTLDNVGTSIQEDLHGSEGEQIKDYWTKMDLIRQKNFNKNYTEVSFKDIKKDLPMFILQGFLIAGVLFALNHFFN